MTLPDLLVLLSAGLGIVLVNWYFLFSRPTARAAATSAGPQALTVAVQGGYSPSVILVDHGRPVRLTFDRREDNPCSEEVVLPAFGIRRYLPAHQQTTVEFTPEKPGRYEFTCGMGMLRGSIDVK